MISRFGNCRKSCSKFSKLKSSPFSYLLHIQKLRPPGSQTIMPLHLFSFYWKILGIKTRPQGISHYYIKTCFHCICVSMFLLNTFMSYSSLRAWGSLVPWEMYKPLRITIFAASTPSFTISSKVIKFVLCTEHHAALAACCLLKYLW